MAFSISCFSLSKSLLYSRHSAISTNLYHNIKSRRKQEIGLSSITNEQCVFCGFSRKHSHDAKYSTGSFQSRRSSRYLVKIRASASSATEATQDTQNTAENLVDALLSMVEETDRGAKLSKPEHDKIAGTVSQLEQFCIPEPLKSPLIFGDWDVDYCSNPTSTGGYYRSAIGRLLLRTKEMTQTIQSPDIVGNKVSFSALNMIDGEVSLKGKLTPLDNKWIQITFDSPYLKIGPFEFQYANTSNVKIAIIYVDDKIRLGKGSRGSIFVFKRRN